MFNSLIIIRTDASTAIGTGHVMRCLTLAGVLRDRGASVSFICREHDGHLCDRIEEQGFIVHRLRKGPDPVSPSPAFDPYHTPWLGVSWEEDAEETNQIISMLDKKPDWLIVDHYALDERWEKHLRPYVSRIFVIDDLADRVHDCDLFLDQNLVEGMETRYNDKVPSTCGKMLGPKYALLQPIYAELHDRIPPREGPIRRILIFFGGVDQNNLTGIALSAVMELNHPDIEVDVVISEKSPFYNTIRDQATGRPGIILHSNLPSLAPLIAKADLAIGASGTTSWERLCLGLPTVVITTAENQKAIAHGLKEQGLVIWLGHADTITAKMIRDSISKLLSRRDIRDWSSQCSQRVDGLGVMRVFTALTISPDTALHVRRAKLSDEKILLSWANDPLNRKNSFTLDEISPDRHHQWFYDKLRDVENVFLYIVESEDKVPIGQVRFERKCEIWEIHYSLATEFRNRGVGRSLLKAGLCTFRKEHEGVIILGRVKEENTPSCKVFESLNFSAKSDGGGWRISVCSDAGSWMNEYVPDLLFDWIIDGHEVRWAHDAAELPAGDMCFFLSYGKIVNNKRLMQHRNNLVVHASDLPRGRGWSPLTWQILEGADTIPVTLFEAADEVDSGPIYLQEHISFDGSELVDDLRKEQARATINLCLTFVKEYPAVLNRAKDQVGTPTHYSRRFPEDSKIDLDRSIREQINLLRVVDNERYPAWFEIAGIKISLNVSKNERDMNQ